MTAPSAADGHAPHGHLVQTILFDFSSKMLVSLVLGYLLAHLLTHLLTRKAQPATWPAQGAMDGGLGCTALGMALGLLLRAPLAALQTADERTAFHLRLHIGNHSLFLSGVFPERIRSRAERKGFPGLSYYESLGRSQFRAAGNHRLAPRYELSAILHTLSERFETTRRCLNDISDRLFSIGEADFAAARILRHSAI
jgi:hypothetical protein